MTYSVPGVPARRRINQDRVLIVFHQRVRQVDPTNAEVA